MKILAIDTSEAACSAAIWMNGDVFGRFEHDARRHSEMILDMVQSVLAEAGLSLPALDALAFGRGPGSFTGLRIGAAVCQGLALATDLPVAPISSLAALAQGGVRRGLGDHLVPMLDARMGEIYWGVYQRNDEGLLSTVVADCVTAPDAVLVPTGAPWRGLGSGCRLLSGSEGAYGKPAFLAPDITIDARDIACLAIEAVRRQATVAPELALPVYLRDQVARKPR
jgi:tRNA threonylcarbamoyladenosine biosynthesis protein TsaB